MQNWAVFTGDIVGSSRMEPAALSQIFAALEAQCSTIATWPGCSAHFMRFRGDGWQMALPPRYALRAALVMRAAARATGKGHDTRIGIGIGAGQIDSGDLAAAGGAAFVHSGHALDTLRRMPLMAAPDGPALLQIALPPCDQIIRGWTPKQAGIAAALLAPVAPTHEALAHALGSRRQVVQRQAETAGIPALLHSCGIFEAELPPAQSS